MEYLVRYLYFFFSSRRRHTRSLRDWSSDVCSSDLAARLERLADAGGICLSGLAHDRVADKLDLEWAALGEVSVRNIPYPVQIGRASCRGRVHLRVDAVWSRL